MPCGVPRDGCRRGATMRRRHGINVSVAIARVAAFIAELTRSEFCAFGYPG